MQILASPEDCHLAVQNLHAAEKTPIAQSKKMLLCLKWLKVVLNFFTETHVMG